MMRTRKGKKVYPLTAAQRLHFFSSSYCPKKQLLNIGTSLTIETELDWGTLKTAIYKAYERCESMRLRFAKDRDGTVYQYIADQEEQDIEFRDFSNWSMNDVESELRRYTEIPFKRFDAPLNRVVMIAMPDGYHGIYLLVDHMTMDAQALILYLKDVIELYCHMKYEGIGYPKEMASYMKQLEKDLAYEAGCKAQARDLKFFQKLIEESEPIFNDVDCSGRLALEQKKMDNPDFRAAVFRGDNVDANITVFHLEEEPSNRLLAFCGEQGISMATLLLMGLRTYFQKENGHDDVSIVSAIARRATLMEKRSGGSRIHCFPCRTVIRKEQTFSEGLLEIRDRQNQLFRHANCNPVEFFRHRSKVYGLQQGQTYEPMSLTYQPLTLKEKGVERLGDIKYKSKWYSNGVAAQAMYLTVMHRAEDNGLDFNFEYQTGCISPPKLEYIYYYVCKILFEGIQNPKHTIGQIIAAV